MNENCILLSFVRKPVSVFSVIFVIEVCFVTPYRPAKRIERKLNELTNAEERDREIRV